MVILKNTLRKIKRSVGRYISLLLIVFVGVGFYSGIQATAPGIRNVAEEYYSDMRLFDSKLVSTLGFSDANLSALDALPGAAQAVGSYSEDVFDQDKVLRIHSLTENMNLVKLIDGRMPQKEDEILADETQYQVGDVLNITSETDLLKISRFTVVGTIDSVLYLNNDYGTSIKGNGKLGSFAFALPEAFDSPAFTEIYLSLEEGPSDYAEALASLEKEILEIKPEQAALRHQEITNEALEEIEEHQQELRDEKTKGEKELKDAKEELEASQKEVDEGLAELTLQQQTLDETIASQPQGIPAEAAQQYNEQIAQAQAQIDEASKELEDAQTKIDEGYIEWQENKDKFDDEIASAQLEIDEAIQEVNELEGPEWHLFNRTNTGAYDALNSAASVVASIAEVFPLFFIVIALLMTSNSMNRMILEERSELGSLASLGYSNAAITSGYQIYALSAATLGVLGGFYAGNFVIPQLIFKAFSAYRIPPIQLIFDTNVLLTSLAVSLFSMSMVTLYSCTKELKRTPASLLRPKPPKKGKTVFLEKLPWLWQKLSFEWKVALRNLFRYKKRAIMTIIGVGGCTALLLAGFGLRDSISGVAETQFTDIFHYDMMITLPKETQSPDTLLIEELHNRGIEEGLLMNQSSVTLVNGEETMNVFLVVPEEGEHFKKYYSLRSNLDNQDLELKGVILTEQIADMLQLKRGDNLDYFDANYVNHTVEITDITPNYISDYVYMAPDIYEDLYKKSPLYNTMVLNRGENDPETLAEILLQKDLALNVTTEEEILSTMNNLSDSIDQIVILIVIIASILAFVVLYNLTSINISERARELATLKVLGFYDREVNSYIYRESMLLTLISIVFGLIGGKYLLNFIITAIEAPGLYFMSVIHPLSYIYAITITLVFSIIMHFLTLRVIKKINMIEALKSVE